METDTEDERSASHPTLASSWDAACGALDRSLRVRGAQDSDWDELLAPPAPGRDLVILERSQKSPDEKPCFLSLRCDPSGGEGIVSVGILSSARNMEVYLGEEYCGTSRGRSVGNVLDTSEHEKIILYKKCLKLESAAHACKIKLLSFGEKPCVFVSKVVVHVRPLPAKSPTSSPALGSRVDLERVHAMVEAMGSTLSPGAQQLMSMVRFQQQHFLVEKPQSSDDKPGLESGRVLVPTHQLCGLGRVTLNLVPSAAGGSHGGCLHRAVSGPGGECPGPDSKLPQTSSGHCCSQPYSLSPQRCIPLGEQLQAVLGSAASGRVLGLWASAPSGTCDRPTCAPVPLRAGLTSGRGTEDVTAPGEENARPPGGGNPAPLGEWDIAPQSHPLPRRDLQLTAASSLPKRPSDSPAAPAPELLPLLQDVCGQVRRLRGAQSAAWPGHVPTPSEGGLGGGMGEPPACSYLEKILSKNLELMERRLMDYLDERLRALQEHVDGKVALLAHLLQSPGSPPPGVPLTRYDSGDRLSNGER